MGFKLIVLYTILNLKVKFKLKKKQASKATPVGFFHIVLSLGVYACPSKQKGAKAFTSPRYFS